MRRPVVVLLPILVFLGALGTPFLRANFASPGMDMLPRSEEGRIAYEMLTNEFAGTQMTPIEVVVQPVDGAGPMTDPANLDALDRTIDAIAALPGVELVQSVYDFAPAGRETTPEELVALLEAADPGVAAQAGAYLAERGGHLSVIAPGEPDSDELTNLVKAIRGLDQEALGVKLMVGSVTAYDIDMLDTVISRLPYAVGFIMVVTYLVLFFLLGSVVLPLKAIAMNLVSVTASFGALIWIFQEGHLSGVLGFEPTGYIVTTVPVMMFCILFGLSMDYEVLMLSRIKEEYERCGDNTLAVARGLERTGRVITSAALIMMVLFGAAVTAKLVMFESLGVGMAIAVMVDATIVRALLVPASMRLMGSLNWWAPRPLRRLQQRAGFAEPSVESFGATESQQLAPVYVRTDN